MLTDLHTRESAAASNGHRQHELVLQCRIEIMSIDRLTPTVSDNKIGMLLRCASIVGNCGERTASNGRRSTSHRTTQQHAG
jgi:hypothetical protein